MGRAMQSVLLFNALMKNTNDSIVIKEYFADGKGGFSGGKIVAASAAKARHYDLNMDNIRGKTDFDLMPHEQAKNALQDDLWVMKNRKPIEDQRETITHKNGEKVKVSVTKFPWILPSGEIIGVMCIARNITIREKAKKQAREMMKFLEKDVLRPLTFASPFFKKIGINRFIEPIIVRSLRKIREMKEEM